MSSTEHNGITINTSPAPPGLSPVTESVALPPDGPAPCSPHRNSGLPGDFDPKAFLRRAERKSDRAIRKEQKIFSRATSPSRCFSFKGRSRSRSLSEHGRKRWSGFREGSSSARHVSRGGNTHHDESCHGELPDHFDYQPAMLAALISEPKFLTFFIAYLLTGTAGSKTT